MGAPRQGNVCNHHNIQGKILGGVCRKHYPPNYVIYAISNRTSIVMREKRKGRRQKTEGSYTKK
jgi:hypothetical protein